MMADIGIDAELIQTMPFQRIKIFVDKLRAQLDARHQEIAGTSRMRLCKCGCVCACMRAYKRVWAVHMPFPSALALALALAFCFFSFHSIDLSHLI